MMRQFQMLLAAFLLAAVGARAQRITVVDSDGNGIHLVSVLTEEGNMIGTTSLEGVIADVKGAKKVLLTHVAFKPQLVDVASLKDGRVTMEDIDYSLAEVVVKPKPYIYVETYYRAYAYINDSLRYYCAGIMPNTYDPQKKKVKQGSYYECVGEFSPSTGITVTWGARVHRFHAGKIYPSGAHRLQPGGDSSKKYFTTLTDEGNGRQRVSNPEGTVGYIERENSQTFMTLDGARMQMYRNKALGQERVLKLREKKDYDYRFTEVFNCDEEGNSDISDLVMYANHWEWNGNNGRRKFIIETYATERSYMDAKEFKTKKKELQGTYKSQVTLNQLESYATSHNIPALAPAMRKAIEGLPKKK